MKVLLVEPNFPYPNKSKHKANEVHKNFVPIGLLKLGSYYKSLGSKVKLVRGEKIKKELKFKPDKILITSLFTYWSQYVWNTVAHYRNLFPKAEICIGGIYVTLHHKTKEFKNLARQYKIKISIGLNHKAEKYLPDYSLIEGKIKYHTTHIMRGCIRRCKFCGTWKLEPKITYKNTKNIVSEIKKIRKNMVIFYDNNFLANPNIKEILKAFSSLKVNKKPVDFESQSGFDGRLLENDPELANLIKKARFQNVRIAWDNGITDWKNIKRQLNYLIDAGYRANDLTVFMIYNFSIPPNKMIEKIKYCYEWGVQIADCRYRPLETTFDNYKPMSSQNESDYYIHKESGWTDLDIKIFRKIVRLHNISIRYVRPKINNLGSIINKMKKIKNLINLLDFYKKNLYNRKMEKWSAIHATYKFFGLGKPPQIRKIENSNLLIKRVRLMNKSKNIFKEKGLMPCSLAELPARKIDKKLEKWASGVIKI